MRRREKKHFALLEFFAEIMPVKFVMTIFLNEARLNQIPAAGIYQIRVGVIYWRTG